MTDFDAIFKAYDVRGTVPDQFNADGAKAIGGAFARFVAGQGETSMVVGHDMRPEGEEFSQAFGDGALEHGADVNLCTSSDGWAPLHNAAEDGNCDAAVLLLDAGARLDNTTQMKNTALH